MDFQLFQAGTIFYSISARSPAKRSCNTRLSVVVIQTMSVHLLETSLSKVTLKSGVMHRPASDPQAVCCLPAGARLGKVSFARRWQWFSMELHVGTGASPPVPAAHAPQLELKPFPKTLHPRDPVGCWLIGNTRAALAPPGQSPGPGDSHLFLRNDCRTCRVDSLLVNVLKSHLFFLPVLVHSLIPKPCFLKEK